MINEREPGDVSQQGFGEKQLTASQIDGIRLVGAGLLGAVLGGAIVLALRWFRAGDEPPIRVKGGSLDLDIVGGTAVWKNNGGDGTKWRFSSGTRNKDDYDVSIVSSSSACANKNVKGKVVLIEYTEENKEQTVRWVKLRAPDKKTKVEASHPLCLKNSGKRLMFEVPGYISKIKVDGYVCTFSSKTELDHALLTEF